MKRKIPQPPCLHNLPQHLEEISLEQFEAWARWFAVTKTLAELRKYQRIQDAQNRSAMQQLRQSVDPVVRSRLSHAILSVEVMRGVADAAVCIQQFRDTPDAWQVHIPLCLREKANES